MRRVLIYRGKQCAPLALADFPVVLLNWQRAMTTFYSLHNALKLAICVQKEALTALDHPSSANACRLSLAKLEQLYLQTLSELKWLINDMKDQPDDTFSEDELKRLHLHTQRLEKQNRRLKRILA